MYYPILRGKREELYAIQELQNLIIDTKNVFPVIELMNMNSTTIKFFQKIISSKIKTFVIINSELSDSIDKKYYLN
ncbi:hypothetical protein K7I13_05220 [Brucepastera parasyntrophica]|uniref:hypothetical protein n=1 Tax=Brucepastera parasyntrophica TaxID=2880008 RepID=UPI00210E1B79|nr:hypothetical protein [Brucepastera parasyntrophica]ULQ60675.1 hypothetical protein K7I13_05220 [Brucepastera parasyntrophica]